MSSMSGIRVAKRKPDTVREYRGATPAIRQLYDVMLLIRPVGPTLPQPVLVSRVELWLLLRQMSARHNDEAQLGPTVRLAGETRCMH